MPGPQAARLLDPATEAGRLSRRRGVASLGIDADPEWTAVHRWSFAKPTAPREQPFTLVDGIGLCGDGWHAPSKVESAWASGRPSPHPPPASPSHSGNRGVPRPPGSDRGLR